MKFRWQGKNFKVPDPIRQTTPAGRRDAAGRRCGRSGLAPHDQAAQAEAGQPGQVDEETQVQDFSRLVEVAVQEQAVSVNPEFAGQESAIDPQGPDTQVATVGFPNMHDANRELPLKVADSAQAVVAGKDGQGQPRRLDLLDAQRQIIPKFPEVCHGLCQSSR